MYLKNGLEKLESVLESVLERAGPDRGVGAPNSLQPALVDGAVLSARSVSGRRTLKRLESVGLFQVHFSSIFQVHPSS
jgi:hypothetical protein